MKTLFAVSCISFSEVGYGSRLRGSIASFSRHNDGVASLLGLAEVRTLSRGLRSFFAATPWLPDVTLRVKTARLVSQAKASRGSGSTPKRALPFGSANACVSFQTAKPASLNLLFKKVVR